MVYPISPVAKLVEFNQFLLRSWLDQLLQRSWLSSEKLVEFKEVGWTSFPREVG